MGARGGQERTRPASRRRLDPRLAVAVFALAAALALLFGPLAALLGAVVLWVSGRAWRTPLPAWLRAVLVGFAALAAVLLYLIGTGILTLLLRG